MKRVIIDVTQQDIEKGVPCSFKKCPLARACHQQGFPDAIIGASYWFPFGDGRWGRLSKKAKRFTDQFYYGESVNPDRFAMLYED